MKITYNKNNILMRITYCRHTKKKFNGKKILANLAKKNTHTHNKIVSIAMGNQATHNGLLCYH